VTCWATYNELELKFRWSYIGLEEGGKEEAGKELAGKKKAGKNKRERSWPEIRSGKE
jgi:hypothetical protein